MPKPWKKFKLNVRYVYDGTARDFKVVMVARSEKEAINRWLWKKCANDTARRNRYHLYIPKAQLPLFRETES